MTGLNPAQSTIFHLGNGARLFSFEHRLLDGHVRRLLANVKLEAGGYNQLSEMFDAEISKRLVAAAVANEKSLLKIETAFKEPAIILDILEACNIPKSHQVTG